MTKKELIDEISTRAGQGKAVCELMLDALARTVAGELNNCGEITLPGIGKLHLKASTEREGRNPSTGEAITIPAANRVKFRALKVLKDAVQ